MDFLCILLLVILWNPRVYALDCVETFAINRALYKWEKAKESEEAKRIPDPFTPLYLENPAGRRGHIRLMEVVGEGDTTHNRSIYGNTVFKLIQEQAPETKLTERDYIYALDVLGEKQGVIAKFAFQTLNSATMDMIGVFPLLIHYRPNPELIQHTGTTRVVFVVKENARDYREGVVTRMSTPRDFGRWAARFLEGEYDKFFSKSDFALDKDHPNFELAYNTLSKIPRLGGRMTEDEFLLAYQSAFPEFLISLKGSELLYLTPSFWLNPSRPDNYALRSYSLIFQRPADEFEAGFSKKVDELKNRLYMQIHSVHQKTSNRNYGFHQPSARSDYIGYDSRFSRTAESDSNPFITESAPQLYHGNDFFTGYSHQNMPVDFLLMSNTGKPLMNVVEKLERHGFEDLSQFQRRGADFIRDRANLDLNELVVLATAMAEHGVYMRYSPGLTRSLTVEQVRLLVAPRSRDYLFDPKTQTYIRISRSKNLEPKPGN